MVVLKADAYGIGVAVIAQNLVKQGVTRIGVAEVKEALEIRESVDVMVQVLGCLFPWEVPQAVANDVICPVDSFKSAELISKESKKQGKVTRVHFLVDTGMGRLGVPIGQAKSIIRKCMMLSHLNFEGIYSHFANANDPEDGKTILQMRLFQALLEQIDVPFSLIHIANSDGINNFSDTYFNLVRTGINLYGVFDLLGNKAYTLHPTLALKTRLISIRSLPNGSTIGYGGRVVLEKETLIGTLPIGYADGIPFYLKEKAYVILRNKKVRLIGNVSMDYVTVDLSDCSEAKLGDEVIVFGKSKEQEITVEDWARLKQSHPYDIICSLGHRVERVYLNGE